MRSPLFDTRLLELLVGDVVTFTVHIQGPGLRAGLSVLLRVSMWRRMAVA